MLARIAAVLLLSTLMFAQATTPAATPQAAPAAPAAMPEAKPGDVDTLDHIIAAVYDVISGPAGQARDWERFKSLFIPEARLIPNGVRDGAAFHRVLSPAEFAQRNTAAASQQGFFEREVSRQQQRYGAIAHIFSTYESRHEKEGEVFARGINSFQFLWDGKRWYVVTILWDSERPDNKIPAEYQKK